ncbi:related to cyclin-like protein CLG1 [Cephalotrichum gorgonifer]|uniref:Related to cyclin-like protein CLG1 n=1 Tax=Cephalotrichum gorgonifer TaxID=2041049 RepID=A0AAE8MR73_9PEZI|nr:related to cyclin-like protein CLG1 [Cephalotrichum gorgonifer]
MAGGVCAVLDYEVEVMAEYVAEMAMRVVSPETPVTSPFRKFVKQILTSTRLPSTTILLGLNYLAKRVNTCKVQGPFKASEGQVWRLLTVSLVLGSKFLDDNTFQNRSWSEVSGIAVAELNSLENEWLAACHWQLYVNLDKSNDYQAWLENWKTWLAARKRQAAVASQRLATLSPIQTSFVRQHDLPSPPYVATQPAGLRHVDYSRHNSKDFGHRQAYCQDSMWAHPHYRPGPHAPITPPDSGYSTPDYASSATSANGRYQDWFAQAAMQYSAYPQTHHHNAYYPRHQSHGHYPYWDPAIAECNCAQCPVPMAKQQYFGLAYDGPLVFLT